MNDVVQALSRAFGSVVHPRMLALTVWPMLIALALWLGLAWLYWDSWSQLISAWVARFDISDWLQLHGFSGVVRYSVWVLLSLLLAPMILITAVLVAAVLEMPLIVRFISARYYPTLEKRRGGTTLGSLGNALIAVLVFAGLWIVTLPLWLTGVLAPVLPLVLGAYLNQRLFRYDALSDHASAEEFGLILATNWGAMYALGFMLALLYYVPLLNLMAPVISGLAFTHFGLARLEALRRARGEL